MSIALEFDFPFTSLPNSDSDYMKIPKENEESRKALYEKYVNNIKKFLYLENYQLMRKGHYNTERSKNQTLELRVNEAGKTEVVFDISNI